MTFNRIADASIDARNPRTANREIPTARIKPQHAWLFLLTCAAIFLAACALFYKPLAGTFGYQNPWPLRLALPVLLFISLYSYTKRFTCMCHLWLGASLMLAPIAAWIAVSPPEGPALTTTPIILGLAVLLWTAGFDIIYACQDIDIDRRDKLFSIPARFGIQKALTLSRCLHVLAMALLLLLTRPAELGPIYLTALTIVAALLIWQHNLVKNGDMKKIRLAFATLNGCISILLAAAAITDIFI